MQKKLENKSISGFWYVAVVGFLLIQILLFSYLTYRFI